MFDPYRYRLRQFIAVIIAKKLFLERSKARRREEVGLPTDVARVWTLMDEAHQFIPSGKKHFLKIHTYQMGKRRKTTKTINRALYSTTISAR
jgi:hypothetical protein